MQIWINPFSETVEEVKSCAWRCPIFFSENAYKLYISWKPLSHWLRKSKQNRKILKLSKNFRGRKYRIFQKIIAFESYVPFFEKCNPFSKIGLRQEQDFFFLYNLQKTFIHIFNYLAAIWKARFVIWKKLPMKMISSSSSTNLFSIEVMTIWDHKCISIF